MASVCYFVCVAQLGGVVYSSVILCVCVCVCVWAGEYHSCEEGLWTISTSFQLNPTHDLRLLSLAKISVY